MIDTQGQTAVPATASDQPSMPQEVPLQPQTTPSEAPAQAPAEPSPPPPEAPAREDPSPTPVTPNANKELPEGRYGKSEIIDKPNT